MGAFRGPELPDWMRRRLGEGLGGICLFGGNVAGLDALAALTAAIHDAAPEAVIGIDEEGGDVTRLFYAAGSPHAGHAALGRVDDPALTGRVASDIGAALRATGVDLDLAPVADVNSNPLNPVIGVRSFGTDTALVARHTTAFVEGLQGTGVGACLKHFPGHGDTVADSHVALPVVEASLEVLRDRELVPFAAGVRAGAVSVMTSHVVLRAIDPTAAATFSAAAVRLLRAPESEGGLAFDGLLVSDALEMRGASAEIGMPAAAVRALGAGVDLLCLGADIEDEDVGAVLDGIVAAVAAGELTSARLAEAAARVDEAYRRLVTLRADVPAPPVAPSGASEEAARRALTVDGPLDALLPLTGAPVLRLVTEANQAAGRAPWGLPSDGAMLSGGAALDVRENDPLPDLEGSGPVVVVVRDAHRFAWVRAALTGLAAAHPGLVVVEMGWPGPDPPPGRYVVRSYGASAVSGVAVDHLLGGSPEGGPVGQDGAAER
jgi:beta-N-acetylhexosaminidase